MVQVAADIGSKNTVNPLLYIQVVLTKIIVGCVQVALMAYSSFVTKVLELKLKRCVEPATALAYERAQTGGAEGSSELNKLDLLL